MGLYGLNKEGALQRLNALQASLAQIVFEEQSEHFKVSLSGGVSEYPTDGQEFDTLVKLADEALYLAKNSGRDKIVLYPNNEVLPSGVVLKLKNMA